MKSNKMKYFKCCKSRSWLQSKRFTRYIYENVAGCWKGNKAWSEAKSSAFIMSYHSTGLKMEK
jgi:hypothetical protein